jgi:hypothetical protein
MMVDFFERLDHIHGEFFVFCLIAPSGGNAARTPCVPSLNSLHPQAKDHTLPHRWGSLRVTWRSRDELPPPHGHFRAAHSDDKRERRNRSCNKCCDLGISFVRTEGGLLLLLDSPKWKLDRGKAYTVRLVAASRSVEGKALAESKSVTVALVDAALNKRLRTVDFLEVKGEGATLRVPLDGSTAALERLDACFEKNSSQGSETNPFVAPSRKP